MSSVANKMTKNVKTDVRDGADVKFTPFRDGTDVKLTPVRDGVDKKLKRMCHGMGVNSNSVCDGAADVKFKTLRDGVDTKVKNNSSLVAGTAAVAMATSQPTNTSEWQLYRVLQRANLLQYYETFIAQGT